MEGSRRIGIKTADGICPATVIAPEGAGNAAIILYMDAFGPRPALETMARRFASQGYGVLLPDLFYRFGDYGPFDAKTAFTDPDTGPRLRGMIGETTQALTIADTADFLRALAENGFDGKVGAVGYCMGGARALNAAAHYPDRIVAAASIHGGNLASEGEDSPHRHAGRIKGRVYVGAAGVDRSFPPEQAALLAEALRTAEVDHILENYVGMAHGWAVPDHSVYDEREAERHWERLGVFFAETLNG